MRTRASSRSSRDDARSTVSVIRRRDTDRELFRPSTHSRDPSTHDIEPFRPVTHARTLDTEPLRPSTTHDRDTSPLNIEPFRPSTYDHDLSTCNIQPTKVWIWMHIDEDPSLTDRWSMKCDFQRVWSEYTNEDLVQNIKNAIRCRDPNRQCRGSLLICTGGNWWDLVDGKDTRLQLKKWHAESNRPDQCSAPSVDLYWSTYANMSRIVQPERKVSMYSASYPRPHGTACMLT
jgi:hypothetical protein